MRNFNICDTTIKQQTKSQHKITSSGKTRNNNNNTHTIEDARITIRQKQNKQLSVFVNKEVTKRIKSKIERKITMELKLRELIYMNKSSSEI